MGSLRHLNKRPKCYGSVIKWVLDEGDFICKECEAYLSCSRLVSLKFNSITEHHKRKKKEQISGKSPTLK